MKKFKSVLVVVVLASVFAHAGPFDGVPDVVKSKHEAMAACDEPEFLAEDSQVHDLGFGRFLYLVPCYAGAYNITYRGYTTMTLDGALAVEPLMVLGYDAQSRAVIPTMDLTNARYGLKTPTLSTLAKGRGVGDCGQSSLTTVMATEQGLTIKTTEIRNKEDCDGKDSRWPVVFKQ